MLPVARSNARSTIAVFGILALTVLLLPQHASAQFTTASLGGMVRDASGAGIPDAGSECAQRRHRIHAGLTHGCQRRVPLFTASHRNLRPQNRKAGIQHVRSGPDRAECGSVREPAADHSSDWAGHRRGNGHRHIRAHHDADRDRHAAGRRTADCGTATPRKEAGAADVSRGGDRRPGTQRLHYLRPGRLLPRRRDGGRERRGAGPGEFPARCHQP